MEKNKSKSESRDEVLERILEETARNPYKPVNKKKDSPAGASSGTGKAPVRKEYVQRTQVFSSAEAQEALKAEIEAQKKPRRTAAQRTASDKNEVKPQLHRPESGGSRPAVRRNPERTQQPDSETAGRSVRENSRETTGEPAKKFAREQAGKSVRESVTENFAKEQNDSKQQVTSAADKINKIKREKAAAAKAAIIKKTKLKNAIMAQDSHPDKPDNVSDFSDEDYENPDIEIYDETAGKYGNETKSSEESGLTLLFEAVDLFQYVLCILLVVFVIFNYMFSFSSVSGESMSPTLTEGDQLLIRNIGYTPKKGDVVTIDNKTAALLDENNNINEKTGLDCKIVKRIIAAGGDTVDIDFERGEVKVNGQTLEEKYISEPTTRDEGAFEYPLTIPEGYVFVLGDNRNVSKDSRHIDVGLIPEDEILGKAVLKIYPFGSIGSIE